MPLMTRINGRPIMLTFTEIPLTNQTEITEVFSDNSYRTHPHPLYAETTDKYYMSILMLWAEYGESAETYKAYEPIRELECRGPRDRVSGPSIYAQAWNKEWGVP